MNDKGRSNEEVSGLRPDEGWWASVLNDGTISKVGSNVPTISLQSAAGKSSNNDWDLIKTIYENDSVISVFVDNFNKGGLLVSSSGIQGFIPASHLIEVPFDCDEETKQEIFSSYLKRSLQVKVIEWDIAKERVVLSERSALAGDGKRNKLMITLKEGDIVEGVVTNITRFGMFLDLGGVEGLIHVSELSWGKVNDPLKVNRIGEKVKAKIINISDDDGRIALSKKQVMPNPWLVFAEKYDIGDVIPATISKLTPYGAFARTAEGIDGLIHISSMGLQPGESIGLIYRELDNVSVEIQAIDVDKRRLSFKLV